VTAAIATKTCLTLRAVCKRFGSLSVLEDIGFSVEHGERRGIIGPNGAGKSTLFNVISGEIPLTSGTVHLLGRDVSNMPAHQRARLGLSRTFQTTTLFPRLTTIENLILALQADSKDRFQCFRSRTSFRERHDEALQLLDRVGLKDRAEMVVDSLGYGEKRQIEILMAIARRPKLLLLDEPTAGLPQSDASLVTEMLKQDKSGMTMVLIEHDMSVVFDVVDRLMVLHYGRVIADGTLEQIRADQNVQEIYLGGKL
jgi:branched-chain amino acid transport system ATP-binding protein